MLSRLRLLETQKTVAHQDLLSMGFPRQEYWSGLPFSSPGDLPGRGMIKPASPAASPALQGDSLPAEPLGKPRTQEQKEENGSQEQYLNSGLRLARNQNPTPTPKFFQ